MHINRTLLALAWLVSSVCLAQQTTVSLAALSVPQKSTGMVHLRTGEKKSVPVQLNKNQFSVPIRVAANKLELYQNPIDPKASELVTPLLSIDLPVGESAYNVLVWSAKNKAGKERWTGRAFASSEWPNSCIILVNFTGQRIGFRSGKVQKSLRAGEVFTFEGNNEKAGSPVKLYSFDAEKPKEVKTVFSSVWRVTENEQEIMVIYPGPVKGTVKTHSFMAQKPKAKEEGALSDSP